MADPRAFADSDSAALRNALCHDGYVDVLIRVIVVLNHHVLPDHHIPLQVNPVLAGDNAAKSDAAAVLNDNRGLASGVLGGHIEPRVLEQLYGIPQADSGRPLPAYFTGKVKRHITPD